MGTRLVCVVAAMVAAVSVGCGKEPKGGPRLETFPLTGKVLVDGAPAERLLVECYPQGGQIARELVGRTDAEGKFSIGTYESGDGVPEGEYKLAFKWEKKREKGFGLEDVLKGRYADPKKSEHTITVKKGEKADLGTIELTTEQE